MYIISLLAPVPMPRALSVCLAIVAAIQIQLAAASPVVEDAPITPQIAELAERLGIDPVRDPSRFMIDAARFLYVTTDSRSTVFAPPSRGASAPAPAQPTIPV